MTKVQNCIKKTKDSKYVYCFFDCYACCFQLSIAPECPGLFLNRKAFFTYFDNFHKIKAAENICQKGHGKVVFLVGSVSLAALGVGGATVFGAALGFVFKKISEKYGSLIMYFASGVMLASAMLGLILPSLELGGDLAPLVTVPAIFVGALVLDFFEKILPDERAGAFCLTEKNARPVMLFVMAIALHNLPEGMAAGVGFHTGDFKDALFISLGIAFQNLPEGMVLISPMLSLGISKKKTFLYACLTGVIEVFGTFIGYFAVGLAKMVLPFALALAGGTMIYVISEDMMRERGGEGEGLCGYALLIGFSLMLVFNFVIK